MQQIRAMKFRQIYYHVKHNYLTMNNLVVAAALLVAAGWAWGSMSVMQRNYALQRTLDDRERQHKLAELEVATLKYQQNYLKSAEYQELAVRERLGYAQPGEKALILPEHTARATSLEVSRPTIAQASREPSNFQAWINFLFGGNVRSEK